VRSSKDLAKRLRFDRFPNPDFFRRRYVLAGGLAVGVAAASWGGLQWLRGDRLYEPGPVTGNHATFGHQCETCHAKLGVVGNESCESCHLGRKHSVIAVKEADCRECHVEHLGGAGLMEVSSQSCLECHRNIDAHRKPGQDVGTRKPVPGNVKPLKSFADHPDFWPSRNGAQDPTPLKFDHKLHLTSPSVRALVRGSEEGERFRFLGQTRNWKKIREERANKEEPATRRPRVPKRKSPELRNIRRRQCSSCHRLDESGMRMEPVTFERDCRFCHKLETKVGTVPIFVLHTSPEEIRSGMGARLIEAAANHSAELFEGLENLLPGVRDRAPVDASKSLQEYLTKWVLELETQLYEFDKPAESAESNEAEERPEAKKLNCSKCHYYASTPVAGELPEIKRPHIPERWLTRSEFGHLKHEMLSCKKCHDVRGKSATSETMLPKKELCLECHEPGAPHSAGTDCVLCHRYHDTSRNLDLRVMREIEAARMRGGPIDLLAPLDSRR
jgi:hypothetical protein